MGIDLFEVKQALVNRCHVLIAKRNVQVLKLRCARESEQALLLVELSTLNGLIVRFSDIIIDNQKGCSSVGNGGIGIGPLLYLASANLECIRSHLPEAVAIVDRDCGQITLESGLVNLPECVEAICTFLEVCGKDWLGKLILDGVEKCLLLLRLDRVDLAEGETDETIRLSVGYETARNGRGKLNSLLGRRGATNIDGVSTNNVASCIRSVTKRNSKRVALKLLESLRLLRVENRVAGLLVSGKRSTEEPSTEDALAQGQLRVRKRESLQI